MSLALSRNMAKKGHPPLWHIKGTRKMNFKTVTLAASAFAFAALGACSESEQEAQEDLTEQAYESQEDVLEEQADLAEAQGDEVAEEALDAEADAMGEMGDQAEDAVDEAAE